MCCYRDKFFLLIRERIVIFLLRFENFSFVFFCRFILVVNRDEFYYRFFKLVGFWGNNSEIFSGEFFFTWAVVVW